jgi:hypothetical protein
MTAVEQAAQELYALPRDDFTRARDELARRLRKEGRRDEAQAVGALRKPTLAAWALNQLVRRRSEDVRRLLDAGRQLRTAQEALVAGGDRSVFRSAAANERDLVAGLTRDATVLAAEAGGGSTAALEERISSTLHAAARDDAVGAELSSGTLAREQQLVGGFGGAVADEGEPPSRPRRRKAAGKPAGQRELSARRAAKKQAGRELDAAEKAARRAADRARDASRRAEEAQARAEGARAEAEDAAHKEAAARAALERAAKELAKAERRHG